MNAIAAVTDIQIRGSPPSNPVGAPAQPVRPAPQGADSGPSKPTTEQEPPRHTVEQAADGVNSFLKSSGSHVQFALHKGSDQLLVEVIDDKTDQVIRTIPSKELLDLAERIGEMVGMFLDKKG